ncbi:MAG: hypothetical protein PVH88_27120 [Ignavibacteria bacterium]|jgi:Tol biopolymer transport system component
MLKELVIILILFSPLLSCKKDRQGINLDSNDSKIIYIEANSEKGIGSGSFGEIVIMELNSKKKYFLTNNSSYEKEPIWGPNESIIIFLTNRMNNQESSNFKGISGPYSIFSYDLKTNDQYEIEVPFQHEKPEYLRRTISDINWLGKRNWIIFRTSNNTVYKYSMLDEFLGIIEEFDEENFSDFHMIMNLKCSPDEDLIAFNYLNTDVIGKAGLCVYNINDSTNNIIPISRITKFLDWSTDNKRLLFYESKIIKEYNLQDGSINIVFEPESNIRISECHAINDTSFVLLASFKNQTNEVALLNNLTKKLIWLTNDKMEKKYLDIAK